MSMLNDVAPILAARLKYILYPWLPEPTDTAGT